MAAPKHPKGAKSDKIWRDAIMRAVRRLETDEVPENVKAQQRLEVLADQLVLKGMAGDVSALREIGDRIDGKPHQTAEITHLRQRAEELTDDELAGFVASGRGEGAAEAPEDPPQLN